MSTLARLDRLPAGGRSGDAHAVLPHSGAAHPALERAGTPSQLPVSWYGDPKVLEAEREMLFARGAGYVGQGVIAPIERVDLVLEWRDSAQALVRNANGVELLSNVCRHR